MPPGQITSESNFAHDNLVIKWTAPENTHVTKYEVTIDGTTKETSNKSSSISFGVTSLVPGKYYDVEIVTVSGTDDVKKSSPYNEEIRIKPTSKWEICFI